MNRIVIFLFSSFIFLGCSGPVDSNGFIKWCEDPENGLIKSLSFGDLNFTMMNKPYEYVLLRENRITNPKEFLSRKNEKTDLDYYSFRITTKAGVDPVEFNCQYENEKYDRIKYFSFDINKDLFLVSGNDTLPCVLSQCERQSGISADLIFTLAFPRKGIDGDKLIIYKDRVYNSGPVRFSFNQGALNNIPEIKF